MGLRKETFEVLTSRWEMSGDHPFELSPDDCAVALVRDGHLPEPADTQIVAEAVAEWRSER